MNEKWSDRMETSGGDGEVKIRSEKIVPDSDTVDTK
ncbi:MAG: hypothetical protein QG633_592 [Patescibacteria group bacterium]|nr:hypothetical protein [Patescibacteria group bacterium]